MGMRSWSSWWFVVVAVLAGVSPAAATSWVVPDAEALHDGADAVVLARVDDIRSVEAFDGSQITTEVTLHVLEGYKGAVPGERLVLHEVGGHVGVDSQWAFGSPEYAVGEVVVAYVERARNGRLRTHSMALGKLETEVLGDGRVMISRLVDGGRRTQSLSSFARGVAARRTPGAARLAGRLQTDVPRLEGVSQSQPNFRLKSPGARWFDFPVSLWGDVAGDAKLGVAATQRVLQAGSVAWNGHAGSEFQSRYAGDKTGSGFTCNPGFISVSFNDPREDISDPSGCGGILAVGGFCSSGRNVNGTPYSRITGGAIIFNDGWSNCWLWGETTVKEVLTHEIGHAIGFAHSWESSMGRTTDGFVRNATMYYAAHLDGRGASLRDYDKGAVAYLYDDDGKPPPPLPTPNPSATPTPTPRGGPGDSDGDDVDDDDDNCPDEPNSLQRDLDDDGVGDACDTCSAERAAQQPACTGLNGNVQIVQGSGDAHATVRVLFPPWIQDPARDIEVELTAGDETFGASVRGSDIRSNQSRTKGQYGGDGIDLRVRKNGGATRVTLKMRDPGLAAVVADRLLVRVTAPGVTAAGPMYCTTERGSRQVTTCRLR